MPAEQGNTPLVPAYTVCLYVVGGLALLMVLSHQMLLVLTAQDEADRFLRGLYRSLQAIELVICVFALTVAVLRTKKSDLARPTTAAVSILLLIWAPFGTAAFIWWVGWVRKRERRAGDCGFGSRRSGA